MSVVVVDDHLLRDILTNQPSPQLETKISAAQVYTTNLWYLRLCRSAAAASGGSLTGRLDVRQRQALGRELLRLPADIAILPFADLAWKMAERHTEQALSTLSCEALVVANQLAAEICVWSGDVGPNLRAACQRVDVSYQAID